MNKFDFNESLNNETAKRNYADEFYSIINCTPQKADYNTQQGKKLQLEDIDVTLHNTIKGTTFTVSEKFREKTYNDVYLEHLSNYEMGKIGWVRDSNADFLAYFKTDNNICEIYRMADIKNIYNNILDDPEADSYLRKTEELMIIENSSKKKINLKYNGNIFETFIIIASTPLKNNKIYHTTGFTIPKTLIEPVATLDGNKKERI